MAKTNSRSPDQVLAEALELAQELHQERQRISTLATIITGYLSPPKDGEDSPDWTSFHLSTILEGIVQDCRQSHRLVAALKECTGDTANG